MGGLNRLPIFVRVERERFDDETLEVQPHGAALLVRSLRGVRQTQFDASMDVSRQATVTTNAKEMTRHS